MHSDGMGRPRRLREMPPPWPRRNDENDEDEPERRQRWDREIEPFEEHGTAELYPGSARAPQALYRAGVVSEEQGDTGKAREYFTRVTTAYGNSEEARRAQDKLRTLPR